MESLGDQLVPTLIAFFVIFARIGAMIMLIPGLGEAPVPPMVRLSIAMGICLLVYPAASRHIPTEVFNSPAFFILLLREIVLGLFLGALLRLTLTCLNIAGGIIAYQGGLALAQGFDPTQGVQGAMMSTFLTITGVTLIFVANLHHLLIGALGNSRVLAMVVSRSSNSIGLVTKSKAPRFIAVRMRRRREAVPRHGGAAGLARAGVRRRVSLGLRAAADLG